MSTYGVLLTIHVIVAILGVGQLAALGVLAARPPDSSVFSRLLRNSRISLIVMFTTGAALDFTSGGAWHELPWFRGSALLMLVIAGLSRWTASAVAGSRWSTVRRTAWAMCASVALITALMELKPQ